MTFWIGQIFNQDLRSSHRVLLRTPYPARLSAEASTIPIVVRFTTSSAVAPYWRT